MPDSPALPDVKKQRKASDTSIISLLPKLIERMRWSDKDQLREVLTELAGKTELAYPAIHKRIEKELRYVMTPTELKTLPKNLVELCTPMLTLDDVVLEDALLADVKAIIEEHDRHDELAEFDLYPRHKVLLHGAPGNGKTMLAEALASSLNIPFVKAKYSGLVDSHLGMTGRNIDTLMQYAASAPCLLFLDEFDCVAIDRSATGDVTEMRRVTNQLLLSLDKLPPHCVFVAATNSETLIDKAVMRRFDFALAINAPGEALIQRLARKELDPVRTPGSDISGLADRIAKIALKNMNEVVFLCRRIRRDLVLNKGQGIEGILDLAKAAQE